MIALLDPVITRPAWTSVVFHHEGMGEAMKGLFEDHWRRDGTCRRPGRADLRAPARPPAALLLRVRISRTA